MLSALPTISADVDYSGLVKLGVFLFILVISLIAKALQAQKKTTENQRRPMRRPSEEEPIELRPDQTGAQPPAQQRLSVEDVALAMRRAERERIARQREQVRQAVRPQPTPAQQAAQQQMAQQRAAMTRAAQMQAAQRVAQQQAAQRAAQQAAQVAQQRAAQMRASQQRQVTAQSPLAGQPIARGTPRMTATAARRQIQDVQESAGVEALEAAQSIDQRHLHLSAIGQGVEAEEARMRGHLQEEDADRTRRFSEETLGQLHRQAAAAAPVRAISALGEMHLNTAAEIGRAVLYGVIIGPPLALQDQPPSWEA